MDRSLQDGRSLDSFKALALDPRGSAAPLQLGGINVGVKLASQRRVLTKYL